MLIKHGDIRGFMPGMTMPFKVRDERLLSGKAAGDLVTARLVVAPDTTLTDQTGQPLTISAGSCDLLHDTAGGNWTAAQVGDDLRAALSPR